MDKITDFLNNEFKPLHVNDTVADAENLFLDFNYSHFPILEQDEKLYTKEELRD